MTKSRLTPEDHADLGATLAAIRNELLHRAVQVTNAYPKTEPQVRHLNNAVDALDSARSALDNALARDYPNAFDPETYYPQDDRGRLVVRRGRA